MAPAKTCPPFCQTLYDSYSTWNCGVFSSSPEAINDDGEIKYDVIEDGNPKLDKKSTIDPAKLKKLTALIKETGFMEIPTESFPVRENVTDYQKSVIKVTLNGKTHQINWVEQNATEKFIPPIITLVELELDHIINQLIE